MVHYFWSVCINYSIILHQLCVLRYQSLLPYLLQNFSKEAAMGSVSVDSTGRTRCEMFADTEDSYTQ